MVVPVSDVYMEGEIVIYLNTELACFEFDIWNTCSE